MGDSLFRRSFRRNKKKKDGKVDKEFQRQSSSNFALALGETDRLTSENRRLRQELEFTRAKSGYQGNDYSFPQRPTLISTEQQTDDCEVIYNRHRNRVLELEDENRELKRKVQGLEEQVQQNSALKRLETKISCLQQKIGSSGEQRDKASLTELKRLQKQIDILQHQLQELVELVFDLTSQRARKSGHARNRDDQPANDGLQTDLEEIKDLMGSYSREAVHKIELLEDILAKEMRRHSSLEKQMESIPDTPEVLKMPSDIKAFAWKLQSYMVTIDKVKHFSRALGLEPDEVERQSSRDQSTPRIVFWSALCSWYRKNMDQATLDRLQQACAEASISVLRKGLMPESDRLVVERCYSYLEDNLHPAVTLPYLRDECNLDASDVFYVTSQSTRRERCASLLNLLPLFGENAFDTFCEALVKSEQSHLADTLQAAGRQGDDDRTIRKGHGLPVSSLTPGAIKTSSGSFRLHNADGIFLSDGLIIKLLSTLLAKTSHVEAMTMTLSTGSNYSSLARSEREETL